MSGLTPFAIKAGTSSYVVLSLDKTIYDADVATATGITSAEPPAGSTVFFLSQRAARRSNVIGRVMLTCKRGKKYRRVPLVCDREKLPTIAAALKNKKVKLGLGTGVDWDIINITGA